MEQARLPRRNNIVTPYGAGAVSRKNCEDKGLRERTGWFDLNLMSKLQARGRGEEEKGTFILKGP